MSPSAVKIGGQGTSRSWQKLELKGHFILVSNIFEIHAYHRIFEKFMENTHGLKTTRGSARETSSGFMGHSPRFYPGGGVLLKTAAETLLFMLTTAKIMAVMAVGITHPRPPRVQAPWGREGFTLLVCTAHL